MLERGTQVADTAADWDALDRTLPLIVFAIDGTILRANASVLRLFGYEAREIVGRQHAMLLPDDAAARRDGAALWDALARGESRAGHYRRLHKAGGELWVAATYAPVSDAQGRTARIVASLTDITAQTIRAADDRKHMVAINASQSVIHFALDGTIIDVNDRFLATMGYRRDELLGRHHRLFVSPGYGESAAYADFWNGLTTGTHQAAEYRRLAKDGHPVWLRAIYTPIVDRTGRPFKIVKYATDVTQDKLREADHEAQIAAIHKSQCVMAFDMDGTIIEANENFLAALGYRLDEVKGRNHRLFVEPAFAETEEYAAFWDTLRAGSFLSAMYKRVGKHGRAVWIQASYNPIFDLHGRPCKIIKFATDVTTDVALADALSHAKQQAQLDAATALPNRVRLAAFMAAALSEPDAQLAILYLDLDRFKPINDRFGHHTGDCVLAEIADRLRRALTDDQIVARVGGDEFVIAAPNLSDLDIADLCRRLHAAVTSPIGNEYGALTVGLSIGIAVSPGDAVAPDELLRCADTALYRSKRKGGGASTFFSEVINERIAPDRQLAEDMRRGLVAGEFFLEYQPRFNARTRRMQSVEALVRWAHPERGRIEPGTFIPVAETSGLIVQLGEWVLRTACRAATAWPGIGVSVNVSPVQFRQGKLIEDTVRAVLAETMLDATRLELEITEGVLLEDAERAHVALGALKALGVRLAMDDFGTGYSSLSYLRSFPFDVIKIDRQFIADIETREGGRSIVQAILGLGKALGLSVTAEGVETTGQLLLLTLDDCSEVQGYRLARPMSLAAVSDLLARGDRAFAAVG